MLYAIIFGGEHFFPEPVAAWRFERAHVSPYLYPGRMTDWDNSPLYDLKEATYGSSHHMTNVFNIFVIL